MTVKEAKQILKLHNWHAEQRKEASIAGDEKKKNFHQDCLTMMKDLYDKASDKVSKLQ